MPSAIPYCGLSPAPDAIWSRWNLDPVLIAALLAVAGLYAVGMHRTALGDAGVRGSRAVSFFAGWAVTAIALVSPLCALSVALLSARIGQHMLLVLAGAPLVAAGRPLRMMCAAWRPVSPQAVAGDVSRPLSATFCFAILLWFWHAPGPYAATFASTTAYWAMHLSLYGSALWLWSSFLNRSPAAAFTIIGAGLVASIQMGLLGAVLTFAPHPIFAAHLLTAPQWGFTALSDQQLGGVIMWVPGCIAFLTVAMLVFRFVLTEADFVSGPGLEARAR